MNSDTLYELARICRNLNILGIYDHSQDIPGLIALIDAQRNLKSVDIYHGGRYKEGTCRELGKALARKGNTINDLYLGPDATRVVPPSFLTSLINLEGLSIHYQKKTNEFHRLSFFKEISALIEKNQGNQK